MKLQMIALTAALMAAGSGLHAQTPVKRIYGPAAQRFANAVWAGDTLYVAGQMAAPQTPADKAKGTPAVYGDTEAQTESALKKSRRS